MEFRRAGYAIVLVILLCALADWNSEEKRRRAAQSYPPPRYMSIEHLTKAKQACNHCRKELVARKEAREDADLYVTKEAINYSKSLPLKKSVIKAFEVLPPQMKKTLLDCLSKNRPASADWFIRCLDTPGRHLASDSDKPKHNLPVSAPFPTSTTSSMYSHSRHFLAMPPKSMPTQPVTVDPFFVPSGFRLPPPSPSVTVDHAQEKPGINPVQLILIVAAVVLCLSVLVTAILLCYKKKGEEESGSQVDSKRDERSSPALSQSTTTTSSSERPPSVGNSGHKELETRDEIVLASENKEFGSKNRGSIVIGTELPDAIPPLKPPPGREVVAAPAEAPPPPPPSVAAPPPPRPPPPGNAPPPPPPRGGRAPSPPRKPGQKGATSQNSDDGAHKAKLKPFFWDKVAAGPNQAMVWNEISSGSFQFNEEKMESLFGYTNANQNKQQTKEKVPEPTVQYIQIIDKKKAQNLSILLKALSVTTEEVCEALTEGNELSGELISSLLKMAPTQEEEMKLKSYDGDVTQLGPAERFLKSLVTIPLAFRRLECLLFMSNLQEETGGIKEAFATLEVASTKLKKSRLFLKLLEAVLKTGNRMNDGTYRGGAMAFKLDTLLKLSDVKGTDGKSTLLNFVVQEIIRFEGLRAVRQTSDTTHRSVSSVKTEDLDEDSGVDMGEHYRKLGLDVVSGLSDELEDVKRAAIIDADALISTLSRLGQSLVKSKEFMKNVGENSETDGFHTSLANFLERAEGEIKGLLEEEKRIMALVKSTGDYFHGSSGKDEGLRLFVIVRDFLKMLDKVCNQIKEQQQAARAKSIKKNSSSASTTSQMQHQTSERHTDDGSSSDGSKDSKKEPFSLMTSAQILQKMLDRYREHMDHESHSDDEEDESDDSSSEKDSSAVASSSKKQHRPSSSDSDDDKFTDFSSKKDSPSVASSSKMQHRLSHSKMDDDSGSDEDDVEDGSRISRSNINSSSLLTSSQRLHQSLDRQRRIFSQRTELQFDDDSSSDEFEDSDSKQDSSSMLTVSNTQKQTSDDQSSSDEKKDSPLVPTSSQTQQQSSDDKSSSDSDKDASKVSRSIKMSASSKMVQQSLDLHRGLLTGQPDDESSSGEEEYQGSNSDGEEKNSLAHS